MINSQCRLIRVSSVVDTRGSLSVVENGGYLPFKIQRVFFLYNLKNGVQRGGHSHKECHQLIIALSGLFSVTTDDAYTFQNWSLSNPCQALYVPPGNWVDIIPQSDSGVLTVLASHPFDEADYIRKRLEFESRKNVVFAKQSAQHYSQ